MTPINLIAQITNRKTGYNATNDGFTVPVNGKQITRQYRSPDGKWRFWWPFAGGGEKPFVAKSKHGALEWSAIQMAGVRQDGDNHRHSQPDCR